jgi:plastocyanin
MSGRPRARRRQLLLPAAAVLCWLAVTVPGVSADSGGASCSPNGTQLQVTALDGKFDKTCLAAPANQAFTIEFNNLDRGIPHNVAIYRTDTDDNALFKGELIEGPKKTTYNVPALPAGNFVFRCDPHPDMHGSFIVAG